MFRWRRELKALWFAMTDDLTELVIATIICICVLLLVVNAIINVFI